LACRLLEPSLMGLLGLLMGWLVLALYVPVLQLGHLM
jgi:type II secretory pathway component PulF